MDDITPRFNRKSFSGSDCEDSELTVSGFERTLTEEYLQQRFTEWSGRLVRSVKIAKDHYGKSLGFATVCFYTAQDAEIALSVTNKRELNGRILSVKLCTDADKQRESPENCVYVKGFGETLDDEELEMYFTEHVGDVAKVEVAKFENGVSKGYGKVQFFKYQHAMKAVVKLDGTEVLGNILTVEHYKPKEQRNQEPNRNVYVSEFGDTLDDEGLRVLFENVGEIDNAKVEKDINGRFKGFGYVCFKRHQDAERAVLKMNGMKLGSKVLKVCPHQSKEERQKELKNRNLHVRNLHYSVSENELKKLFAPYGKILNVRINSSPLQGINQGHVCFDTASEADNAVAALDMHFYKGLKLKVSPHQTKNESKESGDSSLNWPHFPNRTSRAKTCKKESDYKNRSKSLGNLTRKKSANSQDHVKSVEDNKPLECAISVVSPLMKTSAKNSANSEQARKSLQLTGSEVSSSKMKPRKIAANFQEVCEGSENSIRLPKNAVTSQPAEKFNKDMKGVANEASLSAMPMDIPDLFKEVRIDILQRSTSKSECNADSTASHNFGLSCNMESPPTVIPKEKMHTRQQFAAKKKKAYICGGNVKRS